MNIPMLREIQELIRKRPRAVNMDSYVLVKDNTHDVKNPLCHTVACIAGWACLLADNPVHNGYFNDGQLVLDITYSQAMELFFTQGWPIGFKMFVAEKYCIQEVIDTYDKYESSVLIDRQFYTSEEFCIQMPTLPIDVYSNIVIDRIDWFIEKEGEK